MAVNRLQHFADPHMLLRTEYNSMASHTCDVCRSKLAGLVGYRCNACNFDVHVACADYFKETVSFLAHPLARPRAKPHALLDGSARWSLGRSVVLSTQSMTPSSGSHRLSRGLPWTLTCVALCLQQRILSAQRVCHRQRRPSFFSSKHGAAAATGGGQLGNISGNRVAKFLLMQAFRVARTSTGGLASPVLDILEAAKLHAWCVWWMIRMRISCFLHILLSACRYMSPSCVSCVFLALVVESLYPVVSLLYEPTVGF
jgi:hypothetical protein